MVTVTYDEVKGTKNSDFISWHGHISYFPTTSIYWYRSHHPTKWSRSQRAKLASFTQASRLVQERSWHGKHPSKWNSGDNTNTVCMYGMWLCLIFFSGIGNARFLKAFFEKADFISNDNSGHLSKMHLTLQELTESGFLAFLRLVGCAYFKKHRNAFPGVTSESLFHSFATAQSEVEQHYKWLEHIHQKIWDWITFEGEMIPSVSALTSLAKKLLGIAHVEIGSRKQNDTCTTSRQWLAPSRWQTSRWLG